MMYSQYGLTKQNVCSNYCVIVSCRYVANEKTQQIYHNDNFLLHLSICTRTAKF